MTSRWARMVLAGLVLCARLARAADGAGQVASLEGTAEVVRGGATQPLKAGDAVFLGDTLKTGPASKLRLLLKDETVLTLAASTQLVVNQQTLGGDTAQSSFGMLGGTLRALVPDRYATPGSKLEVETPTAIAGVRGTGFLIVYDPASGTTTVVGLFHTTWVRAKDGSGEVTVGPGTSTTVRRGRRPQRPGRANQMELQRWLDATDVRLAMDELPPAAASGAGGAGVVPPTDAPGKPQAAGSVGPGGVVDQPVDKLKGLRPPPSGPNKPPPPPPNAPGQSGTGTSSNNQQPPGKP